jgi:hypothetical protein|tara:strand:- start:49 stop:327 length:279 start_codon:yes stop_codon:yes gene_type:complete
MKITKERLIEIIKEELNSLREGSYEWNSKEMEQLKADLKAIGRDDIVGVLLTRYQYGPDGEMEMIHNMAKKKDMDGLDLVYKKAKKMNIPAN